MKGILHCVHLQNINSLEMACYGPLKWDTCLAWWDCVAVCMDACMITQAWKAAPQCICLHFCTSWTCHLQTLASVYVIMLNDDEWILWMSFEYRYCFLCGIAAFRSSAQKRYGCGLGPICFQSRQLRGYFITVIMIYSPPIWVHSSWHVQHPGGWDYQTDKV